MARIQYADDDTSSVKRLVRIRFPSVLLGLALGVLLSFATSQFAAVLSKDIRVAYFIPFIVYLADAVGTQTQNIFARDLKSRQNHFKKYLHKEMLIGAIFGFAAGLTSALISFIWFQSQELSLAVGASMFCAVAVAPMIALFVTEGLQLEHLDPAVGAGPIATVIQDTSSVVIYGLIASLFLL